MEEGKMAENTDVTPTEPLCLKPVEARRATDTYFVLLLPLSLLVWFGIGTYEFLSNTHLRVSLEYHNMAKWYFQDFFICGAVALLVIFLLLLILSVLRDNWVVSTIKIFIIGIAIIFIALTIWQLALIVDWSTNILLLIFLIIYFVYHVAVYICTKEVGATVLGPMIREPFKAITHSFAAPLFSLIIICLLMIIFINTAIGALIMKYIIKDTKHSFVWLRIIPFVLGGLYVFNFIWNFGFMVLGDYFANHYGTLGNQHGTNIFRSMGRVLGNHLGTVAFLATPIFPSVCALVVAFKTSQRLEKQSGYKLINFVSKIWLIVDISTFALIQTAIYGYKSLKSITEMFDLQRRNALLFLTLNAVPLKVAKSGIIITMTIAIICHVLLGFMDHPEDPSVRNVLYPSTTPSSQLNFKDINYVQDNILLSPGELVRRKIMKDLALATICASFITIFLVRPAACAFAVCKMIGRSEPKSPEEQPALGEQ